LAQRGQHILHSPHRAAAARHDALELLAEIPHVADLDEQIILAGRARQGPWCDCRALPALVDAASRVTPIGLVLADAEFDTEQNHQHGHQKLGARSIIPAKAGRYHHPFEAGGLTF
jgi:hypothetical protein